MDVWLCKFTSIVKQVIALVMFSSLYKRLSHHGLLWCMKNMFSLKF